MTLENAKRLHKHYIAVGNTKAAAELVAKRPELGSAKAVPSFKKGKK